MQTANRVITRQQAANTIGISPRQVGNLVKTYREGSAEDMVHKGRGQPSNRGLPHELRASVLEIITAKRANCGPTLICDELRDNHSIEVCPETLRRWMIGAGLWSSRQSVVSHRRWRERRPSFGSLVQMDSSFHHWFGPELP
ncbi:MAG: hypothetical protein LBR53_12090, partial [Deltaproteobacteria bacterium]|nr:hypothetical protein [Deltaproteobacteria bacterium]